MEIEMGCPLPSRRSRLKGNDKGRDDPFAETQTLEAKRMLLTRAASRLKDGKLMELLFIAARKAHLKPRCEEDVYIKQPRECGAPQERGES